MHPVSASPATSAIATKRIPKRLLAVYQCHKDKDTDAKNADLYRPADKAVKCFFLDFCVH